MAQQNINYGAVANDGTGDSLRLSQIKAQDNFTDLYLNKANDAEAVKSVNDALPDEFGNVNVAGGSAVERTIKPLANTTQYTLIAADFTDFILDFTANLGESIQVILNAGVAPLNGQIQAISSGNNFLVPTAGGVVSIIRPAGTNLKTTSKGWFGGVVLSADVLAVNGNLESTDPAGQTYSVFDATTDGLVPTPNEVGTTKYLRQDGTWVVPDGGTGTTYSPFTNTVDGLVPAPNVSGTSTFLIAVTTPTEGQEFTEGDTVILTSTITENIVSPNKKVLKSDGWQDDGRPIKPVTGAYSFVKEDIFKHITLNTELPTIEAGVFSSGDLLVITGDRVGGNTITGAVFLPTMVSEIKLQFGETIFIKFLTDTQAYVWGSVDKLEYIPITANYSIDRASTSRFVVESDGGSTPLSVDITQFNGKEFIAISGGKPVILTSNSTNYFVRLLDLIPVDVTIQTFGVARIILASDSGGIKTWIVSGDIVTGGNIVNSPNGTLYRIGVNDEGTVIATAV